MKEPIITIKMINNDPPTFEAIVYGDKVEIGEMELMLILKIIDSKTE